MIMYSVPFPPSTNTYWRHVTKGKLAGRSLISERGRNFRTTVIKQIGAVDPIEGKLEVVITLYPPDRRRRDVDNYCKGLLDAFTHAGVWRDDSQIKRLTIEMAEQLDGVAVVTIRGMA